MNKWVCITDKFSIFKYGEIYDAEILDESVLGLIVNETIIPVPLYTTEDKINYKHIVRTFGSPKVRVYHFISLDEWREMKINEILSDDN